MSRPWVLVCLLVLFVLTSQLDWKQQTRNVLETSPNTSQKLPHISERKESVKEKIILSQEKNIQKLNELVHSLRDQLLECKDQNKNGSKTLLAELLTDDERQPLLED